LHGTKKANHQAIGPWMAQRRKDVAALADRAEAKGRQLWERSTRDGSNRSAARPGDVRALGVEAREAVAPRRSAPKPILRGDRGVLSDAQIANIIFNETRSLSGPGIERAGANLAHAILNGDEALGERRPKSGSVAATIPAAERGVYTSIIGSLSVARTERAKGVDPTNGGRHFNFRNGSARGPFQGDPIRTQSGPLRNSFPTDDLRSEDIYSNTYQD
jgi:hypothetical protein